MQGKEKWFQVLPHWNSFAWHWTMMDISIKFLLSFDWFTKKIKRKNTSKKARHKIKWNSTISNEKKHTKNFRTENPNRLFMLQHSRWIRSTISWFYCQICLCYWCICVYKKWYTNLSICRRHRELKIGKSERKHICILCKWIVFLIARFIVAVDTFELETVAIANFKYCIRLHSNVLENGVEEKQTHQFARKCRKCLFVNFGLFLS